MPTHYEILGVPPSATAEEVRLAYRRLVKAAHPDLAGDPARFRVITEAYDVLSDPLQRADYDRSLRPVPAAAPPRRRPRYGRYAALLVTALVAGGVAALAVATARQSVGDGCLVGTWRAEAYEVPFRGFLDGREVEVPISGGAGVRLTVAARGRVRSDYSEAAPLTGARAGYRVEGTYQGSSTERWEAAGGRLERRGTDTSALTFTATINGRAPDQPLAVTVIDRAYPYTCTPTTLDVGPDRYTRL